MRAVHRDRSAGAGRAVVARIGDPAGGGGKAKGDGGRPRGRSVVAEAVTFVDDDVALIAAATVFAEDPTPKTPVEAVTPLPEIDNVWAANPLAGGVAITVPACAV